MTENQPKPLLKVGGKPIVEHIVDKIEEIKGVDEIFVVTNHKFHHLFEGWCRGYKSKKRIEVVNDGTLKNEDRLGAIGDLHYVVKEEGFDDDVLLIAGDNLFGFSLERFLEHFNGGKHSVVAFCDLKDKAKVANRLGVGILDEVSRLVEFEEKPAEPRSTLAATCCYLLSREDIKKIPDYIKGSNKYDNPGDFMKWLIKRSPVEGFVFDEHWFDIGSFEGLEEANNFYSKIK